MYLILVAFCIDFNLWDLILVSLTTHPSLCFSLLFSPLLVNYSWGRPYYTGTAKMWMHCSNFYQDELHGGGGGLCSDDCQLPAFFFRPYFPAPRSWKLDKKKGVILCLSKVMRWGHHGSPELNEKHWRMNYWSRAVLLGYKMPFLDWRELFVRVWRLRTQRWESSDLAGR